LGGVFDSEFEEASIHLFEKVTLVQIICIYSDLTEGELFQAPKQVKEFFQGLPAEGMEQPLSAYKVITCFVKPGFNISL